MFSSDIYCAHKDVTQQSVTFDPSYVLHLQTINTKHTNPEGSEVIIKDNKHVTDVNVTLHQVWKEFILSLV